MKVKSSVGAAVMFALLLASGRFCMAEGQSQNAYDQCSSVSDGSLDMLPCLSKLQHEANQELIHTFQHSVQQIEDIGSAASTDAVNSLRAALKEFEAFRNKECQRVGSTYLGGSGSGAAQASCAVDLTRWYTMRIKFGS